MIQIKRIKRKTKYFGFWFEKYQDYEKRVNDFLKTVKTITVNTRFIGGQITHFVVYEAES